MATDEAPSRSFMVMDDILSNYDCNHYRGLLDWEVVECNKRDAVGCEPADKHILDGISLCVLRGDDNDPKLYPDMSIRLTDDAFDQVGMMIDDDTADLWGRDMRISCSVCAVEADIMVIRLAFTAHHVSGPLRAYYLVYDSANASLFMLPLQAPQSRFVGTGCPLPLRRQDGGCTLALLANTWSPATDGYDSPTLCLCSLSAPGDISHKDDDDDMDHQWVVKGRRHLNDHRFNVHMAFSCNGNAIWADLTQGIIYCSYIDLLKGGDRVNFRHIRLPKKHRIPHHQAIRMGAMHVYRNIGLVGNSIWFVCITPSDSGTGDTMVEVWTLDLTQPLSKVDKRREWAMLIVFTMHDIWQLDAFNKDKLPKSLPRFPVLRQQDDCVLYMLLPNLTGRKGYLVGIDVVNCRGKLPQIVSSRRLAVPWMRRPVVLPLDFFKPRDMLVSS
jgi:hypothetical protein